MTATGTTLGSLDYMSPEQVKSEPTDARSDLYSVGVSLYEMVTGHRMFSATSSYSVMEAHVKEIPRAPIEVQPNHAQSAERHDHDGGSKDPAQRFQTAEAFRNALVAGRNIGATAAADRRASTTSNDADARWRSDSHASRNSDGSGDSYAHACAAAGRWPPHRLACGGRDYRAGGAFGGTQVYRSHRPNAAVETRQSPTAGSDTAAQPSHVRLRNLRQAASG